MWGPQASAVDESCNEHDRYIEALMSERTGTVRIGQIGVGYWGKNLLRDLSSLPGCCVVSCCDFDPETRQRVRRDYPNISVADQVEALVEASDIDAVVIATPPATHHRLAMSAIEAGKDVFVEKPMVLNLSDGEELVSAASASGRILMVGHLMEYHPAVLKLKTAVDDGSLGEIYYIYSERVNLGKIRREENALWSFAPHDISMVLFLLGGEQPISVAATGRDYLQDGIEDVAFITLYFGGKTMAHIHVSWLDPHKARKLTVVGSRRMAVFDDMSASELIRVYDKGVDQGLPDYESYGEVLRLRTGDILIPSVRMTEPLKAECQHFLDCVRTRATPRSDGQDGLRVLRVLDAAQRSLEAGGQPMELAGSAPDRG